MISLHKTLAVLAFFALITHASGQNKEDASEMGEPIVGPNSSYYQYGTISFGAVVPFEDADSLMTAPGFAFASTSHYKFKVTNWFSVGLDFRYAFSSLPLTEDSIANPFYPFGGFEKQKLKNHRLDGGGFLRFNVDKRGNSLGKFIDVGGFAGYNISQRMKTWVETDPKLSGGVDEVKWVEKKLGYTEKLVYGVEARLGFNNFELSARYRLSDFFKSTDGRFESQAGQENVIPDMPRLTVSLGFAVPSDLK